MNFVGYANLDESLTGLLVTPSSGVPQAPDATPTWQVYGPQGPMTNGSGACEKFAADDGLYSYEVPARGTDGFEVNGAYTVVFRYAISGTNYLDAHLFLVT